MAGLVIPGEAVMLTGGVLVYQGHAGLGWMVASACLGAVAGDSAGYWLGRALGKKFESRGSSGSDRLSAVPVPTTSIQHSEWSARRSNGSASVAAIVSTVARKRDKATVDRLDDVQSCENTRVRAGSIHP